MFSELPKAEKTKFFNILLENEINFTRDDKGYYVALVKVLNPAFHGETKQNPITTKKPLINSNTHNQAYQSTPIQRAEANNNSHSYKKQRSTSQSANNSVINTNIKDVNNTYSEVKQKHGSSLLHTPGFDKALNKGQLNKFKIDKPKDNFKKPAQSVHDIFNGRYRSFLQALNPMIGVRGKKINLFQLKYYMEEIYSIRFIKDTSSLRSQLMKNNRNNADIDMKDPFPSFVVEFLSNKYVKKQLIDQHSLDILLSTDYFKNNSKEIRIFYKFLNEEYDTDDLIFFLFVRSCIEKEMKIMFIEKAREEIKLQQYEDKEKIDTELYLNIKTCFRIANTIFGNEEELLLNSFMEKIEQNLVSSHKSGKNMIAASSILEITLEDYHNSRQMYSNDKSSMNIEKLLKKEQENENLFDDFQVDTNDFKEVKDFKEFKESQKRVSLNKLQKDSKFPGNNSTEGNNILSSPYKDSQDHVNNIKAILSAYIKEKELDVFFDKLMASYSLNERNNENIEMIMTTIKELVTKKLGLLINIVFSQDHKNWFISLKIKEEDSDSLRHFQLLVKNLQRILSYQDIEDIPLDIVESFSQTLLSTPELNNQIHKLVLKHFS